MKNNAGIFSMSTCLLLLIVSGCSEENPLASKTEDELMTAFKDAQADCHPESTTEAQLACLALVDQSPEAKELKRRFKEAGGYRTLPSGTRGNALGW
ncbi:MAG: hypothetical protein RJS97_05010 [Parvibaculaceae bacterium]